jgi:hypothetical protein
MNPICSILMDALILVVERNLEGWRSSFMMDVNCHLVTYHRFPLSFSLSLAHLDIQVPQGMSIQHPVLTVMTIDHAAAPDLVVADTVVALEITQGPDPVREIIIIPVEDLTPEVEEKEAEAHADRAVSALSKHFCIELP